MRYVVEGMWTGYISQQCRVVHREVVDAKRGEKLKKLHTIVYTDGTSLIISVREAKPRERVNVVHAYTALIKQAERTGKSRVLVADLPD